MDTVVIGGGTGYMGQPLVRRLRADGYRVVVVGRDRDRAAAIGDAGVAWRDPLREALHGAVAVVNLAGASVGRWRWTPRRKAQIVESRVTTTTALVEAIAELEPSARPPVFVSSSGIDYAGNTGDAVVGEDAAPGDTFLARVCVAWEAAARRAEQAGVRTVLMRTPLVVGPDALALRLLVLPFRLGVGGRLGDGRQWFPWISLDDAVEACVQSLTDDRFRGPVNLVGPDVRRQSEAAAAIARVLGRPARVPTPAWALRLALGEQADVLLHGQRTTPETLLRIGFTYRHATLEHALAEALDRKET